MKIAPAVIALGGAIVLSSAAAAQKYAHSTASVHNVGGSATVGGTVVPYKEVTLSAQIPGAVTFIAGREGETFKSGTILVSVDDQKIRAKRRQVVGNIMAAQENIRNAQVQHNRELFAPSVNRGNSNLSGMGMPMMFDQMFTRPMSNMIGQSDTGLNRSADLYKSYSSINQARTRLLQAQASLQEIDAKIRDASLKAPFNGMIVKKLVEIGDTVQPGQPLVKFAYVKYLRIQAEVPVRLVTGLRKGMLVPAKLDAGDVRVNVRVAQIFPMADPTSHTVTVKFDVPQGIPGGLGMYAEVKIPNAASSGRQLPAVPATAIVQRGSLSAVFVLENGEPSLRLVRTGAEVGGGRISILSGLKGGEQVITAPSPGLKSKFAMEN
ncbi:MAG: efflux RND transporter periplasmic adaptor subunit [Hyphomicrobiales bacterium]|nr:MAG: efflux RND transporter periplasmic adaptor subunit [Hyphomicrobiales bacterium]